MLTSLWNSFINLDSQSITTILVGSFVFIIYRIQKVEKIKTSSTLIFENIKSIQKEVESLQKSKSNGVIDFINIPYSNLLTTAWYENRHNIINFLSEEEVDHLNLFFGRTEILKKLMDEYREHYIEIMKIKGGIVAEYVVGAYKNYKEKVKEVGKFEESLDKNEDDEFKISLEMISAFEKNSGWFKPNMYNNQINNVLTIYESVTDANSGKKLLALKKHMWFLPFWISKLLTVK